MTETLDPIGPPTSSLVKTRRPYGKVLEFVFSRFFGPIHYPEKSRERLQSLSQEGTLVFITRTHSTLMALYQLDSLSRSGFPVTHFATEAMMFLYRPLVSFWGLRNQPIVTSKDWASKWQNDAPSPEEFSLAQCATNNTTSLLIVPPRDSTSRHLGTTQHDFIRTLIAVQKTQNRPILLIPHVLIAKEHSGATNRGFLDRLFGDRRQPGHIRNFFMLARRNAVLVARIGDTIDLKAICTKMTDSDDVLLARRVRQQLHETFDAEERVIAGPMLPRFEDIERRVLRSDEVQLAMEHLGEKSAHSLVSITQLAGEHLNNIAARYNATAIKWTSTFLDWLFGRIYDGVVVDESGMQQAVETAKKGPLIFCPSHKSHIDYLVLSAILWKSGVTPPHIAAGANLSFFPAGTLFRRCGAFFLRRSFRSDPLYAAVFRGYLAELIRLGTSIEFFIEGTRSRTGKVLMPRFGLLHMLVQTWLNKATTDLHFIPVAIDYERILEASSYAQELEGRPKKKESFGQVLKSIKLLRLRYGRVNVQFGQPIALSEFAKSKDLIRSAKSNHQDAWRMGTEKLAYTILHQVATISSVTPISLIATALLSHRGRALNQTRLLKRVEFIKAFLTQVGARTSKTFEETDNLNDLILKSVDELVGEGFVVLEKVSEGDNEPVYRVPEDKRSELDYFKNTLMNYFAPTALTARSILCEDDQSPSCEILRERTRFLSWLFKREFIYRVSPRFDRQLQDTLEILKQLDLLTIDDSDNLHILDREALEILSSLLDTFVEAYWIAAQAVTDLRQFPMWEKEMLRKSLERAKRAFLEGEIRHPETANQKLLQGALDWMFREGVITKDTRGRRHNLLLTGDYADAKLDELIQDIKAFI
jgi:glycerol-3-phosphate O-acyltransferase